MKTINLKRKKTEHWIGNILERNAFTLTNPESPNPLHVWKKGNRRYRFIGWESNPTDSNKMAENPKYITMEQL